MGATQKEVLIGATPPPSLFFTGALYQRSGIGPVLSVIEQLTVSLFDPFENISIKLEKMCFVSLYFFGKWLHVVLLIARQRLCPCWPFFSIAPHPPATLPSSENPHPV